MLDCPSPSYSPVQDGAFADPANADATRVRPRVRHAAMDVLGLPDGLGFRTDDAPDAAGATGPLDWRVQFATGPVQQGLDASPLQGEPVGLWAFGGDWSEEAGATTDADGWASFPGATPAAGLVSRTAILEGDSSCARAVTLRLAAGTQVVLTDIDGTLTVSDEELFAQIGDPTYDPVAYDGAPALMNAWADKGIQPVYMTARPHVLRTETRAWLRDHGYPDGPVISSPELVFGSDTAAYKTVWVGRIVDALGWDVVAAYGNAETDIEAYLTAIPAERVWIIGENAGEQGTNGVEDDWNGHLDSFVRPW